MKKMKNKENGKKIIYYSKGEKSIYLKMDKYDSLCFLIVNKRVLKEYYRNNLKNYLIENGYNNFKLEEE